MLLHLSKDTVNKYVNEYNEKREELRTYCSIFARGILISTLFPLGSV